MAEVLKKYEIKETKEIVFRVEGEQSKFVEGKEFIPVRRWEGDKILSYFLRDALRKVE